MSDYPKTDCVCAEVIPAAGDPKGAVSAPKPSKGKLRGLGAAPRKKRKGVKGYGKGTHCVFSRKSGKMVRCYKEPATAKKVAAGFGPGFKTGKRKAES
jgi:hypothetical protein